MKIQVDTPPKKYFMKGSYFIIPISETEYKALKKILPNDYFMGMNCNYKKHYLVESQRALKALKDYQNSIVVHRKFN